MADRLLTTKQLRFIEFYDGNATDAARKAGYKGNDVTLGAVGDENLKKPRIKAAIKARETKRNNPKIATREERQAFWTTVLKGEIKSKVVTGTDAEGNKIIEEIPPKMSDRLKSSELLGRSEADFVDKVQHSGELDITINIVNYKPIA